MTIQELETQSLNLNGAVAAEVRAWCGRKRVTQRQLASALGISAPSMSARFAGKTPFGLADLMIIAALLNITLGELLGSELVNEKDPQHFAEGLRSVATPGLDPGTSRL